MSLKFTEKLPSAVIKHDKETGLPIDDGRTKQYLLLIYDKQDPECRTFELVTGRKDVYEYVKEHIDEIDLELSHILSETTTIADAVKVVDFMRVMKDHFEDEEFVIDDYVNETVEQNNDDVQLHKVVDQTDLLQGSSEPEDI